MEGILKKALWAWAVAVVVCSSTAMAEDRQVCLDQLKERRTAEALKTAPFIACADLSKREPTNRTGFQRCMEKAMEIPEGSLGESGLLIPDATATAARVLEQDRQDTTKATTEALVKEGATALSSGDTRKALEHLNEALRLQPHMISALWTRAQTYERLEQRVAAITDYKAIVAAIAGPKEEGTQDDACRRLAELDK